MMWAVGLLTLLAILFRVLTRKRVFYRLNLWLSLTLFAAFCLYGYVTTQLFNEKNRPDHFSRVDNITAYQVQISDDGQVKSKTYRFLGEIHAVKDSVKWYKVNGKVYVYFPKDTIEPRPRYGDILLVNGRPDVVLPPGNPGEFDYKRFLAYQNVHHQDFIQHDWYRLEAGSGNAIMTLAYQLRSWASDQFSTHISGPRERHIVQALVLGIKDGLDRELTKAYAATGAMHVLAVSGLHVGIIYLIVVMIFGKFKDKKYTRWIFALLSLTALWSYAMLTGFSPSVLRAVTMFSFIIVARVTRRQTNIYNTLAASAFLLLLYDPFMIMSVGFQLSYLAVAGIVFFQPRIYGLWSLENYWLDKLWSMTAVAIAAQIATFPLGLLYFHKFPVFFAVSNLVVIPGALATLVGGLLVLVTSWIQPVAVFLGDLLQFIVTGMNYVIFIIERLPYAQVNDIYINPLQAGMLFGLILFFTLATVFKKPVYLYAFTLLFASFIFSAGVQAYQNSIQSNLTFYNIRGHTVIEALSGQDAMIWADSSLMNNRNKLDFHVGTNHIRSGITNVSFNTGIRVDQRGLELITSHGKSILLLKKTPSNLKLKERVEVDYIIYTRLCKKDLGWVRANFEFDSLLLDGSLFKWQAERLKQEADDLDIPYHSIFHQGALQVNI